ncbi:MAG TPA: ShlB/FhaC/HecB family hemolysin secretion/activation protein [Gemmatimonadaceae bacterium]|nr:ShlB/FhaC/HecB family hemolysin secretion/activation protein [Gemmatimonadaceae bacterium]
MTRHNWQRLLLLAVGLVCLGSGRARSQSTESIVAGPDYDAGPFARKLLGNGWRSVWLTPVRVPVFDMGTYAGGLTVSKKGGGNQTRTLRFATSDGREIMFRSVDKFPVGQAMPAPIRNSTLGDIVQDQVSTLFPAGALMVPAFLDAIGALHVVPKLYVMPDDPRLGEFRKEFAGMLGTVELSPQEDENDEPGFAGSRKIKSADKFLDDLEESRNHHLDERELFAVRLVDFLVNDNDRTADNMRFARYGDSASYSWRPLPRDRDRAFSNADGWLFRFLVHPFYPKLIQFKGKYDMEGLLWESYNIDRRLLQRITKADADQIGIRVRNAIDDSAIEKAIAALPPEWRARTNDVEKLRSRLRARRDLIPKTASDFYDWLATEVDVHGTDQAERAVIERLADGRLTVTIQGKNESRNATPFFIRTFVPGETREVRVFLHGGNDVATVRGARTDDITVRVIGGGDDDFLADSAGAGDTHFYDEKGKNQYVRRGGTSVSEKEWKVPRQGGGVRFDAPWRPDWGRSISFGPSFDYVEGGGLVVGIGPRYRVSGFRHLPHKLEAGANVLLGTGDGRTGLNAYGDYRFENSPDALTLDARATRFEAFRFFGYGNNSPKLSRAESLVNQDLIAVEPLFIRQIGWRSREDLDAGFGKTDDDKKKKAARLRPMVGKIAAGPVFRWNRAHLPSGSPPGLFDEEVARAGGVMELELDKTSSTSPSDYGFRLVATGAAYPALFDIDEIASVARASAAAYVPIASSGLSAAFRLGGATASGDIPVQEAPYIGGRSSVRGYSARRFIGDAAGFGSAEIRMPLGTVPLLINWNSGVFGLLDAGRVWVDGDSPGKWHAGYGAGVWISALGQTFSVSFAHGDSNRFYLQKGMSF